MGASSSTSVTDFKPNSDEISKAVVLSSLAYLDNAERKAAIENRYSHIGFENILMAHDFILGECKQNNSSTLFVAFRWRFCMQDMFALKVAGRDEFTKKYSEAGKDVRGLFHNELFQRIITNLPSISYFESFKADKIIFSGHSLAGALAHLFLACYMLKTHQEAKRHISIGFGSPFFCDSDAKRFCENTMELDKRMFTLVNGADPVPWLLFGIRMTVACTAESIESTTAEKLSSCLDELNSWLNPANSEEMIEIETDKLWLLKIIRKEMQSIGRSGSPHYADVGAYYEGKELKSVSSGVDVRLMDVNAWKCHRVECYVEEFSFCLNEGRLPMRPRVIEESSPCIHDCNLSIYHSPTGHEGVISIRGLALSEFKKFHVRPNYHLLSGVLSKTEAAAIKSWENDENSEQTHLSVYIRTCFGSTTAKVNVENPWRDSYVACALNRAMGRLLLMKQSNVLRRSSDEYREAYRALRRVFGDTFVLSLETKREQCETLKLLLTGPVETPVPNYILEKLKYGLSFAESEPRLDRKLYVIFSTCFLSSPVDLCSVIAGHSCISRFADQNETNESNSSYVSYCISDNKLRKLNYLDILRTIYCLLTDTESQNEQLGDVGNYENKIYVHVQNEGPVVKRRQGLPEGILKEIENRAWKIYKTISAGKLLEGFRMAAFIGPENVGKTTLINSILGENVGDVGFTTHTSAATLYRFTNDIFIVDFPGTDAGGERAGLSKVWEYYEKVADLCIVVLNFGGDTSRAAEVFLRIAPSRMCENVVLVINRVDSVLNGSQNSSVWVEYSPSKIEQLRMSFAESCGLPIDRVFLSVSRAREELEETTCRLLEERASIMMKDEITRKLRWLLCGTQATTF